MRSYLPYDGWTLALYLCGLVCCVAIAWEDWRHRSVRVAWLVGLGLLGLGVQWRAEWLFGWDWLANSICWTGMVVVMWVYLWLRRGVGRFWEGYFGWGDVVFLYVAGAWLPAERYVLYLSSGMLLSLVGAIVFRRWMGDVAGGVPLAGLMAVWLVVWVVLWN